MEESRTECAICFDVLSEPVALPCTCRVDYCARCWDRCLLQSFKAIGWTRCPTCRCAVHVDFDAESRCLTSRLVDAPLDLADSAAPASHHMGALAQRHRLSRQMRPAQVRSLQQYGLDNPVLKSLARAVSSTTSVGRRTLTAELRRLAATLANDRQLLDCPEDLIGRRLQHAFGGSCAKLASSWAEGHSFPLCACGGSLKRVEPASQFASAPRSICDLCQETTGQSGFWTCSANQSTILHASGAYSVCDACFSQHALLDGMRLPRACSSSTLPGAHQSRDATRCPHLTAPTERVVVINAFAKNGEDTCALRAVASVLQVGTKLRRGFDALQAVVHRSCSSRWQRAEASRGCMH